MKSLFAKQFEEEFLYSERLRVSVLLGILIFGVLFSLFNYFTLNVTASLELRTGMLTVSAFLSSMVLFELSALLFVRRKIKLGNTAISTWMQYVNAFIEISFPSIVMMVLARIPSFGTAVFSSPLVSLYFIFIILSTLRLDYRITLFISLVGAVEFFCIAYSLEEMVRAESFEGFQHSYMAFFGKSLILVLAGLGASFVALQIRRKIDRSVAVAETGNKIVNLFGKQISKEIVDEMLERNGEVPSKLMRVCVMFIDIRNFTAFVSGKSPAEIVEYQNAFFSLVIETVAKHGGIINQFLGDGCMVTFGAPQPLINPCQHAVNAALEIKSKLNTDALPKTTIGIGIHVGEAVTGNIGTELRQQYSITGNVVILAARIEQLNKEYGTQILTSTEVVNELRDLSIQPEALGLVSLKGWNEPMHIYKLA